MMISKVLRDLLFSQNQPLKSFNDQYIGILKCKLVNLNQEYMTLSMSHETCSYICMYVYIYIYMQLKTVLCYTYTYDMTFIT
jgi:hypothetical protein